MALQQRYPDVATSLLQQSEALHASIRKSIEELQTLHRKLDEKQAQIDGCNVTIEQQNHQLEAEKQQTLDLRKELDQVKVSRSTSVVGDTHSEDDNLPIISSNSDLRVSITEFNGTEYVTKGDYENLQAELQSTSTKYQNVRTQKTRAKRDCDSAKEKLAKQNEKYDLLKKDYKSLQDKCRTWEEQFGKYRKTGKVCSGIVDRLSIQNTKYTTKLKEWRSQQTAWMKACIESGQVVASFFDPAPRAPDWLNAERLLNPLSNQLGMLTGPSEKKTPPAYGKASKPTTLVTPTKTSLSLNRSSSISSPLLPRLDTDIHADSLGLTETYVSRVMSDEEGEPDTAFSPTRRAIFRPLGPETLLALHPEPPSPIDDLPKIKEEPASLAIGTKHVPIKIKSEPSSEPDWYGKFGYSRMPIGDEDSLDLDNIVGARYVPTAPQVLDRVAEDATARTRELSISQDVGRAYVRNKLAILSDGRVYDDNSLSTEEKLDGNEMPNIPHETARPTGYDQTASTRVRILHHEPDENEHVSTYSAINNNNRQVFQDISERNTTVQHTKYPTTFEEGYQSPKKSVNNSTPKVRNNQLLTPQTVLREVQPHPPPPSATLPRKRKPTSQQSRLKRANIKDAVSATAEDGTFARADDPERDTGRLFKLLHTPTQQEKLPPTPITVIKQHRPMEEIASSSKKTIRNNAPIANVEIDNSIGSPADNTRASKKRKGLHSATMVSDVQPPVPKMPTTTPPVLKGRKRLSDGIASDMNEGILAPAKSASTTVLGTIDPANPFSPSRYRINPNKNDGFNHAFTETVREKTKKACLTTCVKSCCKDLASGKLQEMWQPPTNVFTGPKFSADSSSPSVPNSDDMVADEDEGYQQWKQVVRTTEDALQFGRHKMQHEKPAEIPHYWDSEMLTTQQVEEQRRDSDRRYRVKGYKMYDESKKGGLYERRDA